MTPTLAPSDIGECLEKGGRIDWHEDYEHQAWCDGQGPLEVLDVHCIDADKGTFFVGYRCSNPQCRRCTDPTLILVGHHKLLRRDGLDLYEQAEFIEMKKKTITNIVGQPVFRRAT